MRLVERGGLLGSKKTLDARRDASMTTLGSILKRGLLVWNCVRSVVGFANFRTLTTSENAENSSRDHHHHHHRDIRVAFGDAGGRGRVVRVVSREARAVRDSARARQAAAEAAARSLGRRSTGRVGALPHAARRALGRARVERRASTRRVLFLSCVCRKFKQFQFNSIQFETNPRCRPRSADAARQVAEEALRGALVERELQLVATACDAGSGASGGDPESELKVRVSRVAREVQATYVRDECAIEMVVRYSACHPLRAVVVDFGRHQGVDEKTARRWALQLRACAQTSSTLHAVEQWRANLDLEFAGVEPCPICYGVLHPKSKRLPHLECKQCHNKFHASCLSHWFQTSHKHLCVVCQTEFQAAKPSAPKTKHHLNKDADHAAGAALPPGPRADDVPDVSNTAEEDELD